VENYVTFLDWNSMMEKLKEILPGCQSVTGGGALSIALIGLSAGWFAMKKKKSRDED